MSEQVKGSLPLPEDPADVIELVRAAVVAHAPTLALDAARLTVDAILNWGGFVNRSFKVSDGRVSVFLKLATGQETRSGLARWRRFADVLETRYRAPAMVGWIDVPGTTLGGPVFEWLGGSAATREHGGLIDDLCALLKTLHGDERLAAQLVDAGDVVTTCADAYLRSYDTRFTEDLEFIANAPPPFLAPATLDWMRTEAMSLAAHVRLDAAFAEPADRPIHGDMWLNNVLVSGAGQWHVLDWDGLGLGDPVIDWAMLFGPSRERVEVQNAAPPGLGPGSAEAARFRTYARASLLDWIIDPLADWVQAEHEPFHGEEIRSANEHIHRRALAAYRQRGARQG